MGINLNKLDISINLEYSYEEMKLIKLGSDPQEMEDKWKLVWEKDRLTFYRSWTGYKI